MSENTCKSKMTEDNVFYLKYVYDLAISKGFNITDATNLSEAALFKKQFEGIKYSKNLENKLKLLFSGEHH